MREDDKTGLNRLHVAVIGGGVIGAASALRLQQSGARVTLIDPADERGRASYGNASLIATELAEPLASWATLRAAPRRLFAFGGPLDFVWRDADAWLPWTLRYLAACRSDRFKAGTAALSALLEGAAPAWRRLLEGIGRPDLFEDAPHWNVWETAGAASSGARAAELSATGPARVRQLATQEVQAVRREVSSRIQGGICLEGSAKVSDPGAVVRALHLALVRNGARIVQGEAVTLRSGPDQAQVGLRGGETIEAELALMAAGARSASLLRDTGLLAPLVAERGYHLQYGEHDLAPGAPPLIFEDRFICVVRVGEAVRVTGFTEVGRPGSPPDDRKWARLEHHVRELGLPVRGQPQRWMGSRPTLPDFLPAIGRRGRLLYAFGHQHIGLTLAAVTADAIAQLVDSDGTPPWLRAFDLKRFSRARSN